LTWLGTGGFICGFEIVRDNYSKREANVEAVLAATVKRAVSEKR